MPNLPEKPVCLAVIDGRVSIETERAFARLGVDIIRSFKHPGVQEAVSWHPDIFLHHAGGNMMVYAPDTHPSLLQTLAGHGFALVRGETALSSVYPADIAYNVARVGRFYFHNLKHTDPVLEGILRKQGIEAVNVKQGYTKCSVSVVDENSIITSDKGIALAAGKKGLDVLLLEAGQNITLPGFEYGFIGGSTGLLGKRVWAVCGDAGKLASYPLIHDFLNKKNIVIVSLSEMPVADVGSILPLKTL